ncbi:MAG: thiaminase II, partial [Nitrososphaeria archaeon]
ADVYSGKEYGDSVQEVVNYIDSMNLSDKELEEMAETFRIGAYYEYEFWDSAYNLEKWPIAIWK